MSNICMLSLPDKDCATLERVIQFCSSRGQAMHVGPLDDADIVICADDATSLQAASQITHPCRLIVVSDDRDCTKGDYQLIRPLLVTRVMRTMETVLSDDSAPSVPVVSTPSSDDAETATKTGNSSYIGDEVNGSQQVATGNKSEAMSGCPGIVDKAESTIDAVASSTVVPMQYHALVVDDSAAIRKQLEIELKSTGIYCDFAESGEQALEQIINTTYDLIFLDIMMPGIDGYEACGQIRKDPRYKRTPVIMLSGKTSPMDEVEGVIAGASTYLTKPLIPKQFQQVMTRIKRWLGEFR